MRSLYLESMRVSREGVPAQKAVFAYCACSSRRPAMTDSRHRTKPRRLSLFVRQPKTGRKKKPDVRTDPTIVPERSPSPLLDPLMGQNPDYIRVVATVLHPEIFYKTLPITQYTTAFEVVAALLEKYATSEEDRQCPDVFYLTETQENEQGNYSRVLENCDRVSDIQMRWKEGKNCYFTLRRRPKVTPSDNHLIDMPLSPIGVAILSTSQDSYLSYPAYIEEGEPSPTLSEFMSDSYFSIASDASSTASKSTSPHSLLPPDSFLDFATGRPVASKAVRDRSSSGSSSQDSGVESSRPKQVLGRYHSKGRYGSPEHRVQSDSNTSIKRSSSLDPLQEHVPLQPEKGSGSPSSFAMETEARGQGGEGGATGSTQREKDRHLMQGIMTKIVGEPNQSSLDSTAHAPSGTKQRRSASLPTDGAHRNKAVSVKLQPLVCSPMNSVERTYPQFVFPSLPGQSQEDELMATGGGLGEGRENGGGGGEDVGGQEMPSEVGCYPEGQWSSTGFELRKHSKAQEATDGNDRGDTSGSLEPNTSSGWDTPEAFNSLPPYSYHKTSKALPVVQFEAEVIIYPHFKATADLYPSFVQSHHFRSEMDMLGSLSSLMEMRLNGIESNVPGSFSEELKLVKKTDTREGGVSSLEGLSLSPRRLPTNTGTRTCDADAPFPPPSLISPARRSKLIEQATQTIKRRRSHSFSAGVRDSHSQTIKDTSLLISRARRDILLNQATVVIRKRHRLFVQTAENSTDKSRDSRGEDGEVKPEGGKQRKRRPRKAVSDTSLPRPTAHKVGDAENTREEATQDRCTERDNFYQAKCDSRREQQHSIPRQNLSLSARKHGSMEDMIPIQLGTQRRCSESSHTRHTPSLSLSLSHAGNHPRTAKSMEALPTLLARRRPVNIVFQSTSNLTSTGGRQTRSHSAQSLTTH